MTNHIIGSHSSIECPMWSLCRAPLKGPDASSLVITLNVRDSRYACVVQELVSMAGEVSRNAAANRVHLSSSWFSHEFKNVFGSFRTAQSMTKLYVAAIFVVGSSARFLRLPIIRSHSQPKKFVAAFKSSFQVSPRTYCSFVQIQTSLCASSNTYSAVAA